MSGGPGAPSRGGQASQGLLSTFLRVRDVTGFLLPEGSCRMISTSSTLLSSSFLPFFPSPFLSPFLFISLFSFPSFLSCLSSYFSFPFFLSPFPFPPRVSSLSPFLPFLLRLSSYFLSPLSSPFLVYRLSLLPSPFPPPLFSLVYPLTSHHPYPLFPIRCLSSLLFPFSANHHHPSSSLMPFSDPISIQFPSGFNLSLFLLPPSLAFPFLSPPVTSTRYRDNCTGLLINLLFY